MLVANIAKKSMRATTYDRISELLKPETQYSPMTPDFIQAACWADDIKETNDLYTTWHYADFPLVNREPPTRDIPSGHNEKNVVWAINALNKTLKAGVKATPTDTARALFFMIHFVGDLHQPLHATTLFSNKFEPPSGDQGGNLYLINYPEDQNIKNLHALWDSGAGQWATDMKRPLDPISQEYLNDTANKLMNEFPVSAFQDRLSKYSVSSWAVESFGLARDVVYKAPEAPEVVPADYLETSRQVCRSQVALAGYRLAQVLESVLGN